jgi:hypothetical protein
MFEEFDYEPSDFSSAECISGAIRSGSVHSVDLSSHLKDRNSKMLERLAAFNNLFVPQNRNQPWQQAPNGTLRQTKGAMATKTNNN